MRSFKYCALFTLALTCGFSEMAAPADAPSERPPGIPARSWTDFVRQIHWAGKSAAEADMWLARAEAARTDAWAQHSIEQARRCDADSDTIEETLGAEWPEKRSDIEVLVILRKLMFTRSLYREDQERAALMAAPTETAALWISKQFTQHYDKSDDLRPDFDARLELLRSEYPSSTSPR